MLSTNLIAAALPFIAKSAASKVKADRKALKPGVYGDNDVKVTITVEAGGETETFVVEAQDLLVSEDETYIPTISIPVMTTLALALRQAGVTRKALRAHLVAAATAALNAGGKVAEELELQEDLDEAMDEVRATMAALPPKTRAGKTTLRKAKQAATPAPAIAAK